MSSSSGIKRGLATAAVSALAVTGLPFLSGVAQAAPMTGQIGADDIDLVNPDQGDDASVKNDGQNTTVRLEAVAGADVSSVTFQYNTNNPDAWIDIATVTRNDDGSFSHEWAPTALVGATVDIRAVSINSTTANPDAFDQSDDVTIYGPGAAQQSVNITDGSALGVFRQPYTSPDNNAGAGNDDDDVNNNNVILQGTTSDDDENSDVNLSWWNNGAFVNGGTGDVEVADEATSGTWRGVLDISGYDFTGSPDQILTKAALDTTDTEGFTLYSQTITTVSAEPANSNSPGGVAQDVVVTVLDQNNNPIAGAEVREQDGTLVGYTDENGQVETTQGSGTQYYYANATDSDPYEPSLGDKKSNDVTVTPYTPEQTTLTASSRDGAAFDFDENNTLSDDTEPADSDIKVQVTDQNGEEFDSNGQDLQYYWVLTPFDGTVAGGGTTQRIPAGTATWEASENGTGEYQIAFPQGYEAGTYELFAGLEEQASGDGDIPSSKLLTVKAGEAEIEYDENSPEQAEAGGEEAVDGQLVLEDGTGLANRKIELTYQSDPGANPNDDATPDAGFVQSDDSVGATRVVTTGADGSFSVTVRDADEDPQQSELGGNIDARTIPATVDNDDPMAVNNNHVVNFLVNTTPGEVTITGGDPALESAGEVESFEVHVESGDQDPNTDGVQSEPLAGQEVTLTTDHGYFTDGEPQGAVGDEAGEYDNDGQSITVTTDEDGDAEFSISIGRDEEFDDDGLVTSTITATAGGVSDTIEQDWTSEDPLNAGEVTVEFASDEQQESGIIPEAPTHDSVALVVKAFDQFGNRVGNEFVTVTNESGDTFNTSTDYDEDLDTWVDEDQAGDETYTVTWTVQDTNVLVADDTNGVDPGTAPDVNNNGAPETVEDEITVQWYAVDFAASTYTLEHDAEEPAPVGSSVIVTYTATDQKGEPIDGLDVEFFRTGPDDFQGGDGNEDDDTNDAGESYYVFQGTKAGDATVTAIGEWSGNLVPESRASTVITFGGATVDREPIVAKLKGKNNGAKADRLRVVTDAAAAGATVKLWKFNKKGNRVLVDEGTLGAKGKRGFVVPDNNGRGFTQYVAKVLRTSDTKGDNTNRRRVR
jgi:hypothetical protein